MLYELEHPEPGPTWQQSAQRAARLEPQWHRGTHWHPTGPYYQPPREGDLTSSPSHEARPGGPPGMHAPPPAPRWRAAGMQRQRSDLEHLPGP
jgi:hypothetical protein